MKKTMVGDVPGKVLGMLADLNLKLQNGTRTPEELHLFLQGKNPFEGQLVRPSALREWEKFYRDAFGLEVDFSKIAIPPRREGFDRLIIVAQGMTPNVLFAKCKEFFPAWRYIDDLDTITSDRTAKDGAYAIWVRDRVEADEELRNKSANDVRAEGILTETLEERFLHELKYFHETRKHLDLEKYTLCTGSRGAGGRVPGVDWDDDGRLCVDWDGPAFRDDGIRSRAVVS